MIDLIVQYRNAKRLAQQINIDPGNPYVDETSTVASMVSDIDFALNWMRNGQPGQNYKGATEKQTYTKRLLLNTDMFPCLDIEPETREQERKLSEHKKQLVQFVLKDLTERQLTCFLLHTAHMRTHEEIAAELGIKSTSVQKHIERAREKIRNVIAENEFEL